MYVMAAVKNQMSRKTANSLTVVSVPATVMSLNLTPTTKKSTAAKPAKSTLPFMPSR